VRALALQERHGLGHKWCAASEAGRCVRAWKSDCGPRYSCSTPTRPTPHSGNRAGRAPPLVLPIKHQRFNEIINAAISIGTFAVFSRCVLGPHFGSEMSCERRAAAHRWGKICVGGIVMELVILYLSRSSGNLGIRFGREI
jgi:hypothetical protein